MNNTISSENRTTLLIIAKAGIGIRNALSLSPLVLGPKNLKTEKEKFFKSKIYNPKYIYKDNAPKKIDVEIDKLELLMEKTNLPNDLTSHFVEYLNDLRLLYNVRLSIGKNTFSNHVNALIDWHIPDPDELLKKLPKFEFKNEKKGKMIKAPQVTTQLKNALLNKYGIKNFYVTINKDAKNSIIASPEGISIGENIKRFQNNVDRLIVHEVESHMIQNYNLRVIKNPLSQVSKLSDIFLYGEGLGVYNEIKTKTITKRAFQNYYSRMKSIKSLHLSFREIYEILKSDGLSDNHSFSVTSRVKRGMSDTSKSGGYTRDAAYLLGYSAIINFLKNNPEKLLYYAKNPNVVKLLMKYNLLEKNEIMLPKFLKENG